VAWKVREILDQALQRVAPSPYLNEFENYSQALRVLKRLWSTLMEFPWSFTERVISLTVPSGTPGEPYLVDVGEPLRSVEECVSLTDDRMLLKVYPSWIDARDPSRQTTGVPQVYSPSWTSNPSLGSRFELWPIPDGPRNLLLRGRILLDVPDSLDEVVQFPFPDLLVKGLAAEIQQAVASKMAVQDPRGSAYYMQLVGQAKQEFNAYLDTCLQTDAFNKPMPDTVWQIKTGKLKDAIKPIVPP
jgi:hypothetical protein